MNFCYLGLFSEIEKHAIRNFLQNKDIYISLLNLLLNLVKIQAHQDIIEDWLKSHSFFKNLECLLNFNFSDTTNFTILLEQTRREFISMPENKRIKGESKKLNKYYLKFLNYASEKVSKDKFYKLQNNDVNFDENKLKKEEKFVGNKMNIPDFAYEKTKEFIKFCLFKQEKFEKNIFITSNQLKKSDSNLNIKSNNTINFNFLNKDSNLLFDDVKENQTLGNKEINCSPNNNDENKYILVFRHEVLENIFKNFKHYSQNESHIYMESNWKLYDLNDLTIIQFHMFMFDVIIEKIENNENFINQISISNWYIFF